MSKDTRSPMAKGHSSKHASLREPKTVLLSHSTPFSQKSQRDDCNRVWKCLVLLWSQHFQTIFGNTVVWLMFLTPEIQDVLYWGNVWLMFLKLLNFASSQFLTWNCLTSHMELLASRGICKGYITYRRASPKCTFGRYALLHWKHGRSS